MRKIMLTFIALITATLILLAFNPPDKLKPVTSKATKPSQFFEGPVDAQVAQNCIDSLELIMKIQPDLDKLVKAYTNGVWFGTASLQKWLTENAFGKSDSIAIRLGIYTREAYERYKNDGLLEKNIGRVTVFIWPYAPAAGSGINNILPLPPPPPYNLGSIHP